MSTERLIAKAIMADTKEEKQLNEDRITCNIVASTKMFCECGSILDQKKTAVLTQTKTEKTLAGCCLKCMDKYNKKFSTEVSKLKDKPFFWITWTGRKEVK